CFTSNAYPLALHSFPTRRSSDLSERAFVPGDRGSHAQARVGVDVRRTDEALHQLVGDVIVLGEQLPGQIKRDGVRGLLRRQQAEDRKSTRLNSSHVAISYAVFCL